MADMKDNGEQMSVDELVSKLKANINSTESAKDQKTISKKSDPDSDIASMLRKFMPEANGGDEDFELDEAVEEQSSEFDLEGEADYDVDMPEIAGEASGEAFDLDDNGLAIDDVFITENDAGTGSDFAEPVVSDASENDGFDEALEFVREDTADRKKKKGGLFSRMKAKSLADGYAKMLEEEFGEKKTGGETAVEPEADITAEEVPAFEEVTDAENAPEAVFEQIAITDEIFDTGVSDAADLVNEMAEKTNDIAEKTDDIAENIDVTAEKIEDAAEEIEGAADELSEAVEEIAEKEKDEPVATQVYVLDTPDEKHEPEEEYFAPNDKNPLIFDDDDETPIIPDGSAFEDVARSDVSEFESETAGEESELDDKDINLMMALGYDDELEEKIGREKIDEISGSLNAEMVDFIDVDDAYAFDGFELNSSDQYRTVGSRYKEEHKKLKLRLIGSGIFAFALLIYELLMMFDVTAGGALNIHHYPVVGIMLSLQLLVLSAALSWRQLLTGLTDMITFAPSPSSIPAFAVLSTVIYDVIMALIAPNTGLQLYNFPAALCLFFLVLNDYFNLSREIRAFHTIATKAPKYALFTAPTSTEETLESGLSEIFGDEDAQVKMAEKTLDSYKLGFVENYFRRTNVVSKKDRKLNIVIYPFLALAIALGVVSFVTNHSGVTAFNISILTVLLCTPISMLFIGSYPFFGAAKTAFDKDAAIIGEASVEEYSEATTVTFSDSEVFPVESTVTRGIKLYDNNAIYYVLYHLTSIYSQIGGPLKVRLEQATAELGHSEDVIFNRIEENGVEAVVDGKVNVLAGQAEFMTANGISIGMDPDDDRMFEEGCSVLYLVLDGVLSAKLYVQYDIDHGFEDVINILADEKTAAVVYTSDPNIDDALLASKLTSAKVAPHIVKCEAPNETGVIVESAESGIVARHSLVSLASTLTLCNKIRRVRKTAKKVSTVSMIISVIMMIFLALFSSKLGVPSVYVALYQIFWMLPLFLFTKLYVK